MSRKNRQDWIDTGYELLNSTGAGALTVEALTSRLNMTKGSFYHHFRGFDDFVTKLMTDFESKSTINVINLTDEAGDATAKLQRLTEISTGFPPGLEIAIRAWALINPQVESFVLRIDQKRIDYVEGLYFAIVGDPKQSLLMAEMMYALWIGGMHLLPRLDESRALKHLNELARLNDLPLSERSRDDHETS